MAFVIRDAVPADLAALRQVYRRASLSNDGDRMNLLANPDALEWAGSGEMTGGHGSPPPPVAASPASSPRCLPGTPSSSTTCSWTRAGCGREPAGHWCLTWWRTHGTGGSAAIEVTANQHALVFYGKAGFIADHEVQTRFGPGIRMHLDVAP